MAKTCVKKLNRRVIRWIQLAYRVAANWKWIDIIIQIAIQRKVDLKIVETSVQIHILNEISGDANFSSITYSLTNWMNYRWFKVSSWYAYIRQKVSHVLSRTRASYALHIRIRLMNLQYVDIFLRTVIGRTKDNYWNCSCIYWSLFSSRLAQGLPLLSPIHETLQPSVRARLRWIH